MLGYLIFRYQYLALSRVLVLISIWHLCFLSLFHCTDSLKIDSCETPSEVSEDYEHQVTGDAEEFSGISEADNTNNNYPPPPNASTTAPRKSPRSVATRTMCNSDIYFHEGNIHVQLTPNTQTYHNTTNI